MLAESQGWIMPLLFLGCLLWALSPMLPLHEPQQRWQRWAMHAGPPLLLLTLLIDRCRSLLFHDVDHPEVATLLTSVDAWPVRLQVMFTGQGAVEGAMLSFMLFSVLSPRLPSLRRVAPATAQAIQRRMVAHAGAWCAILMTTLLPESAYESLAVLPPEPTQTIGSWSRLSAVVLATLVLIMSGELISATGLLATTREPLLLLQRAVLKMALALPLLWWCWALDADVQSWWERPSSNQRTSLGLLIALFGTAVTAVHVPTQLVEGRSHTNQHPTRTTVAVAITALLVMPIFGGWMSQAFAYTTPLDGFWIALRLTTVLLLVAGGFMLLPLVGMDGAHRPELWWFRAVIGAGVPVGLVLTSDVALLVQGALITGTLSLLWPWMLEHQHRSQRNGAVACLIVVLVSGALTWLDWPLAVAMQAVVAGAVAWSVVRSVPGAWSGR
jgi:hypothetical protein